MVCWSNFLSVILDSSISAKIVPKTFKISNQPHSKGDQFSARWTDASKTASLEWIKIVLETNLKKEQELLADITSKCNILCFLTPNEKVSNEVKIRVGQKGYFFRRETRMKRNWNLKNLRTPLMLLLQTRMVKETRRNLHRLHRVKLGQIRSN